MAAAGNSTMNLRDDNGQLDPKKLRKVAEDYIEIAYDRLIVGVTDEEKSVMFGDDWTRMFTFLLPMAR